MFNILTYEQKCHAFLIWAGELFGTIFHLFGNAGLLLKVQLQMTKYIFYMIYETALKMNNFNYNIALSIDIYMYFLCGNSIIYVDISTLHYLICLHYHAFRIEAHFPTS